MSLSQDTAPPDSGVQTQDVGCHTSGGQRSWMGVVLSFGAHKAVVWRKKKINHQTRHLEEVFFWGCLVCSGSWNLLLLRRGVVFCLSVYFFLIRPLIWPSQHSPPAHFCSSVSLHLPCCRWMNNWVKSCMRELSLFGGVSLFIFKLYVCA